MTFLRRLLGRDRDQPEAAPAAEPAPTADPGPTVADDEQARNRELLRADAARLDELAQRQLRYARYAWTPPAQGGERRADDEDTAAE